MKALMFAPAFAPNMGSESLVASKLVLALRNDGWDVDVISRREPDLYSSKWEPPWAELASSSHQLSPPPLARGTVLAARLRDALTLGHPIAGLRWAAVAVEYARNMMCRKDYDVLLSRSPPDIGHLPALILSRKYRMPWIANWNDPPVGAWPEPYGAENGSPLRRWLYRRFVRETYLAASLNTFPSAELSEHVERHFGLAATSNSMVIPHVTLPSEASVDRSSLEFRLTHAGKLAGARSPAGFLEGLRRFIMESKLTPNQFVVRQIGHADRNLNDVAQRYEVGAYISSVGPMPYAAAMQELSQSTVNLLVEAPCAEGIFLPGKFTDYAQARRPILAVSPKFGVSERMLREYGGGRHANVEDPGAIHSALRDMYREWQGGVLDHRYETGVLLDQFSPRTVVADYREAVSRATGATRA